MKGDGVLSDQSRCLPKALDRFRSSARLRGENILGCSLMSPAINPLRLLKRVADELS